MKKLILTFALVASFVGAVSAQVDGKAIGLRFNYGGAEVSYQHPLSKTNRVELDLGVGGWRLGAMGIYHWVWNLDEVTDGLKWYAGPGVAAGLTYGNYYSSNQLYLGIAGQVGIEYKFEFPLQLSLDYRPAIYLVRPTSMSYGNYDGVCLSARYVFK